MNFDAAKEFTSFVNDVILPALADIDRLAENNRIHLQKLVYTNLVDRFDSMIDHLFLDNCRHDELISIAEKDLKDQVTEAELLRLLMESKNLETVIDNKLKMSLRNTVLRQRHSIKLHKLVQIFQPDEKWDKLPRVNISTGEILDKITPQKQIKQPYSICGYTDWLYSRRNSIVHGAGQSSFLENDKKQLKKLYGCDPAKTFKVSLASVKIAAKFYTNAKSILIS